MTSALCTFRGMWRLTLAFLVTVAGCALTLPACGTSTIWFWDCREANNPDFAPDGTPNPCPRDSPADGGSCTCVQRPYDWDGPAYVWFGDDPSSSPLSDGPPVCPSDVLGVVADDWHADLNPAPPACASCTCLPSKGKCELPSQFTASTATCAGGLGSIPFDAPASWDGGCDNTAPAVPPNKAKSMTIGMLTIKEESCERAIFPNGDVKDSTGITWKKMAHLCYGKGWKQCDNPQATCIPLDHLPADFDLCVTHDGDDQDCNTLPGNYWPIKHVYYKGANDSRQCLKECTCGPPTGSMCTAKATIYQSNDNTCNGPIVEGNIGIGSTMTACVDIVPAGQPLGSKSATAPVYVPGSCAAIPGDSVGDVTPKNPVTICCKQR